MSKKRLLEKTSSKVSWYKSYEKKLLDDGFEAEFNPVNDNLVTIEIIGVPKNKHGQGYGSKIMNTLTNYADKQGITLQLRPSASSTHSRSKLINFYSKFGFIENKGKDINEKYQYMYRLPKEQKVEEKEPVVVLESSIFLKKGQILTKYKEKKNGILVENHFIPKKNFIKINEALTNADEKRVKELIRSQLKYFFWQLYTKNSFMLGNI